MLNVTDEESNQNLTEEEEDHAFTRPLLPPLSELSSSVVPQDAADVIFDRNIRIIVLVAEILAGTLGGAFVCAWLCRNRHRRSRISVIILNVTATDLLVICFACVMQLIWEAVDRNWMAGDAMCRILKWGQSFAIISSNNMLVVLSVDRHQDIRSPLKEPFSVIHPFVCICLCSFLVSIYLNASLYILRTSVVVIVVVLLLVLVLGLVFFA